MWSIFTKEKNTSTQRNVGKKEDASEFSGRSLSLKTRCQELIIGDYIEIVCRNNLNVLIVKGKPSNDALKASKIAVLEDFMELSGASDGEVLKTYREIALYRENILSITVVCDQLHNCIDENLVERGYKILNACGVSTRGWGKIPTEKQLKRAMNYAKNIEVRMRDAVTRYEKNNKKEDITESRLWEEFGIISDFTGRTIGLDYNLAMYAGDKRRYAEYAKRINAQNK